MRKLINLNMCGFGVKILFSDTEFLVLQKEWISQIKKYWSSFIVKNNKKIDYTIEFVDFNMKGEVFIEEEDGDFFQLRKRMRNKKKTKISYSSGLGTLNGVIKDLLVVLMGSEDLILHASSCINKNGQLFVFMAPSGGGKSTTSRLLQSEGWIHFSDDFLVVRKVGESYVFYPPPYIEKEYSVRAKEYTKGDIKIFFVYKEKNPSVMTYTSMNFNLIKKFIGSVVLRKNNLSKRKMRAIGDFVDSYCFYKLNRDLNQKKLSKVLNEIK